MNSDPSPPQHSRPGNVLDPGGRWVWLNAGLIEYTTFIARRHSSGRCSCHECAVAAAIERADHDRATIYHDKLTTTVNAYEHATTKSGGVSTPSSAASHYPVATNDLSLHGYERGL